MSVWQRFEDPVWRKAAEQQRQGLRDSTWALTDEDTKKERQHKLRVKDWLFKNNLTEELLLNHPSPDDVIIFREIRLSSLFDYFTPSDIACIGALEEQIIIRRKSLNNKHRQKLEQAVIRAQRLQARNLKRLGTLNGKSAYQKYKKEIQEI